MKADRWWEDPAPVDAGGGGAISDEEAYALINPTAQTNGQFITLPDGRYVLIDPKTGRIIRDLGTKTPAAGSGGGGGSVGATQGQLIANQFDQQQLAQQNEQFFQNMGYEKARFGIEQEQRRAEMAAAEARNTRDFAAEQHWNQVATDLNNQRLQLDQQKQQFDQYKTLADLASNPRNFVQTFFMNRGQTPPPDVARYGNTTQTAADILPFQQFQQKFMGAAASPSGAGVAAGPSAVAPSTQNIPGNPYAGTNINYGGSATTADKATINGTELWAGGAYSGRPVASSPANAGDLTPYLKNPNLAAPAGAFGPSTVQTTMGAALPTAPVPTVTTPTGSLADQLTGISNIPGVQLSEWARKNMPSAYGDGGPIPEMVVGRGVTSGQTYVFGEAGPETVVPQGETLAENKNQSPPVPGMYARGGMIGYDYPVPMPMLPPGSEAPVTPMPMLGSESGVSSGRQVSNIPGTEYNPFADLPVTPMPIVGATTPNTPPTRLAPGVEIRRPDPTTTPTPMPTLAGATPTLSPVTAPNTLTSPSAPLNPLYPSVPGGVLGGLINDNAVPPFLRRIFEQNRGNAAYGTNIPQRNALPQDLPLVSKMGWAQLSPSEQEAMLSYVSSLGVTPEDYLASIYGSAPQPSPRLPRFLFNEQ